MATADLTAEAPGVPNERYGPFVRGIPVHNFVKIINHLDESM